MSRQKEERRVQIVERVEIWLTEREVDFQTVGQLSNVVWSVCVCVWFPIVKGE